MKRILTHIALQVKDTNASADFYREWCGMDVIHSRKSDTEGQPVMWLASPGYEDLFVIVLLPGRKAQKKPEIVEHLGFSVDSPEDLQTLLDKAKKSGNLYWDYQEHPFPVGALFGIRDPDGNVIEFSVGQPLGRDLKNDGPQPQ